MKQQNSVDGSSLYLKRKTAQMLTIRLLQKVSN